MAWAYPFFIFSRHPPLDVFDINTTEQSTLSRGDLIGFGQVPRDNVQSTVSPNVAEMKVIASGRRSCRAKQVVEVRLTDLQDMFNALASAWKII